MPPSVKPEEIQKLDPVELARQLRTLVKFHGYRVVSSHVTDQQKKAVLDLAFLSLPADQAVDVLSCFSRSEVAPYCEGLDSKPGRYHDFTPERYHELLNRAITNHHQYAIGPLFEANSRQLPLDQDGATAVLFAADRGKHLTIEALVRRTGTATLLNLSDAQGRDVSQIAENNCDLKTIEALERDGAHWTVTEAGEKLMVAGLRVALLTNDVNAVHERCVSVLETTKPPGVKVNLLRAADARVGPSGLAQALERGQAMAVEGFCNAVLYSDLPGDLKTKLIDTKSANGSSGLVLAVSAGHAEAVKMYCAAVLGSDLSVKRKIELLAAPTPDGRPAHAIAKGSGVADALKVYDHAISGLDLTPTEKAQLIAAMEAVVGADAMAPRMPQPENLKLDKISQLPPGEMARQLPDLVRRFSLEQVVSHLPPQRWKHVLTAAIVSLPVDEAVAALACLRYSQVRDWRAGLDFPSKRLQQLLNHAISTDKPDAIGPLFAASERLALDQDGCAAALLAAERGHHNVIGQLRSHMGADELLKVQDAEGRNIAHIGASNNHPRVVEAVAQGASFEALMAPNGQDLPFIEVAPPERRFYMEEIIADRSLATAGVGKPELFRALLGGRVTDVSTLCDEVLKSQMPAQEKVGLLRAADTSNGLSGLAQALSLGHTAAAEIFCLAVLYSDLPDDLKTKLIDTKSARGWSGLVRAVSAGHAEAVRMYCATVLGSNLPVERKAELLVLAAPTFDGKTALAIAKGSGFAGALRIYYDAISGSDLTPAAKAGLVRPSRPPQLSAGVLMEVIPSLSVDQVDAMMRVVDQGRGRAIAQFAARDGHLEMIETLAKHSGFAEWMKPGPDGRSLIHHAARCHKDNGQQGSKVIKRLVSIAKEKGLDPMSLVAPDCEGNTPLTHAAPIHTHPSYILVALLSEILKGQEQEKVLAVLTAINQKGQTFADVAPPERRPGQIAVAAVFSGVPSSVLEYAIEKRRAEAGALGPDSSAVPGCEVPALPGGPPVPLADNSQRAPGTPTGLFSLAPPLHAAPDAAGQPPPPPPQGQYPVVQHASENGGAAAVNRHDCSM